MGKRNTIGEAIKKDTKTQNTRNSKQKYKTEANIKRVLKKH